MTAWARAGDGVRRALLGLARANAVLALSTAAATWMVQVLARVPVEPVSPAIVGLVFYSVYTLDRAADHAADAVTHASRAGFSRRYLRLLWASAGVAYVLAVALAAMRGAWSVAVALLPLAAVLLYTFRIMPPSIARRVGFARVKEVFVLKNVYVAATLGAAPALLLVAAPGPVGDARAMLGAGVFMFARWWINVLVFDVRDEAGDRLNGLRTVPVVLGRARTLRLLHAANALLGAMLLAAPLAGLLPPAFAVLAASSLYAWYYLWRLEMDGDVHFLCDVIADGELAVQASVLLVTAV
ncbi:MAG: UbiA prenyltransferase [Gemmatimonadetes bacterium]|nr:UbiA prenyltransferase [Gemmatimonadota bacterium]